MMNLDAIVKKALKDVKATLKKMTESKANEGVAYIKEIPAGVIDTNILQQAAAKKAELDVLLSQVKMIDAQYQPLRAKVLEQLPGNAKDKVEVVIDGIQIKKHSRTTGGGKLDEAKLGELARKKKILSKVTKKVTVFDEEAVLMALHDGLITYEEYVSCLTEGKVTPVIDIEYKECPQQVVIPEEQDAAV
jgi:hypothetical protein